MKVYENIEAPNDISQDLLKALSQFNELYKKHTRIWCIGDRKGWVQHWRFLHIKRKRYFPYQLYFLTMWEFKWLWKLGFLRKQYIYFMSWRIVMRLLKENPRFFKGKHYEYFMTSLTSHSNLETTSPKLKEALEYLDKT